MIFFHFPSRFVLFIVYCIYVCHSNPTMITNLMLQALNKIHEWPSGWMIFPSWKATFIIFIQDFLFSFLYNYSHWGLVASCKTNYNFSSERLFLYCNQSYLWPHELDLILVSNSLSAKCYVHVTCHESSWILKNK